jgi:hypothetical protein
MRILVFQRTSNYLVDVAQGDDMVIPKDASLGVKRQRDADRSRATLQEWSNI